MRTLTTLILAVGMIPLSGAFGAPKRSGGRQVSWWSSTRAVPVAAYTNDERLGQDALALKGLGRTVLPMRALFHSLGATVDWDATERAVTAWKEDGTGVRFVVGERRMELLSEPNGSDQQSPAGGTQTLDAPAMLIANRVYVPVRAAVEALGAQVRWAGDEPAIYLSVPRETQAENPQESADPKSFRDLSATLTLPKYRFRVGESIRMELTVTNQGEVPVALSFPTGQQFDFQVVRDNRIVWSWSGDRAFTQSFTTRTLAPGKRLRFTTRWRQLTSLGGYVTPGIYTVRGIVTASPRSETLLGERQIRIQIGRAHV